MVKSKSSEYVAKYSKLVILGLGPANIESLFHAYLASCKIENRRIEFYRFGKTYHAHILIESAEVCSRIVGRSGLSVRYIREVTETAIDSPRIVDNRSTNMFTVAAKSYFELVAATFIILMMADYFQSKIAERLALKNPNDILTEVDIMPQLVPRILAGRGAYLIHLRTKYNVNIVSPKPYSVDPKFYIIGSLVNVCCAESELMERIRELSIPRGYKCA